MDNTRDKMSYEYHTSNQCDKCAKEVGQDSLIPLDFLYLDMNDVHHEDKGRGYRHYSVCKECMKNGV
jgi:hypothetical protein